MLLAGVPTFAWVTALHLLFIDIAYFRRYFRLIAAIHSAGFRKKHFHAVVRVDGIAQPRHAHSGLRADQSRALKLVSQSIKDHPLLQTCIILLK